MWLKLKDLLRKVFIVSLLMIGSETSLTYMNTTTIGAYISTMRRVSGNKFGSILQPDYVTTFNISLAHIGPLIDTSPYHPAITQIRDVSVSQDQTVMAFAWQQSICWNNFVNNILNCDNSQLIIGNTVKIGKFLATSDRVIIVKENEASAIIANLSAPAGSRFVKTIALPQPILTAYRDKMQKKIVAALTDGSIIEMNYDNTLPFYEEIVTTLIPPTNLVVNKIISYSVNGTNKLVRALSDNTLQVYKISDGSLLKTVQLSTSIITFMEADSTILVTDSSSNLIQFEKLSFNQINRVLLVGNTSGFIFTNYPETNPGVSPVKIVIAKPSVQYPSQLRIYKVFGVSLCRNVTLNCKECDLFDPLKGCYLCDSGWFFNFTTKHCDSIPQCTTGYEYNSFSNTCDAIICTDLQCQLCDTSSTCMECMTGYNLSNQSCVVIPSENPTQPSQPPQPNQPSNSSQGQSVAICKDDNCKSCLVNSSYCESCVNSSYYRYEGTCQQFLLNDIVSEIIELSIRPLSVPSIREVFSPTIIIFMFLDDYWYYIYHDRKYKIQIQMIFEAIKGASQQKLVPNFLETFQDENKIDPTLILKSNYSDQTPSKVIQINQGDIQFLKNTYQMFTWNYFGSIGLFTALKIVYILTKLLISQCKFHYRHTHRIIQMLKQFSFFKMLLVSLVQGNLIFISFNCGLQLLQPGLFTSADKFNNLASHVMLFVGMFYSFCFYILLYAWLPKQDSQFFLNYSNWGIGGFVNESLIVCFRNLFNGFLHAYLLVNYRLQIGLLLALKIATLIFAGILRNKFQKGSYFVLFESYFLVGALLDFLLIVQNMDSDFLQTQIGLVEAILLLTSCAIVVLIFLLGIVYCLIEIKRYFIKNRIQPSDEVTETQLPTICQPKTHLSEIQVVLTPSKEKPVAGAICKLTVKPNQTRGCRSYIRTKIRFQAKHLVEPPSNRQAQSISALQNSSQIGPMHFTPKKGQKTQPAQENDKTVIAQRQSKSNKIVQIDRRQQRLTRAKLIKTDPETKFQQYNSIIVKQTKRGVNDMIASLGKSDQPSFDENI